MKKVISIDIILFSVSIVFGTSCIVWYCFYDIMETVGSIIWWFLAFGSFSMINVFIIYSTKKLSLEAAQSALDRYPGNQFSLEDDYLSGILNKETFSVKEKELQEATKFFRDFGGTMTFFSGTVKISLALILTAYLICIGIAQLNYAIPMEKHIIRLIRFGAIANMIIFVVAVIIRKVLIKRCMKYPD